MQNRIVIWGASGHARVVAEIIRLNAIYEIVGFLDDDKTRQQGIEFAGSHILGGREELNSLQAAGVGNLIIAVGHCQARLTLAKFARAQGLQLVTAIHPRSSIASDVSIGAGTVIVAGVVVNPGSLLGENIIINTSASVDHECVIEDGVHIGPGVHLGGRVKVGKGSWVGIGAVVKDRIEIGSNTIIGAGAVVLDNIPDGVVAYGVPARVIRTIQP
jgi:UDP-N-acetylbacillosamine N-acetyltransferase